MNDTIGTGCWSHLATRAAVSLQVFDELWSGSVSNGNQRCAAIGQPGTVKSETQQNQLQRVWTVSVGQCARHTPAYLVLGARPWGMTGLRQGMDMMLMLRYRPWLIVQDSSPSAITERKKRGSRWNIVKSKSQLWIWVNVLQRNTRLTQGPGADTGPALCQDNMKCFYQNKHKQKTRLRIRLYSC